MMTIMRNNTLTLTGKLKKRFLPAIYFDSSVLIDYRITEGMELSETQICEPKKLERPDVKIVRDILRSEARTNEVLEIRKNLIFEKVRVTPVISPISLLELMEWEAEAAFKQIASEAAGTLFIQKRSKKQIGDYLKIGLELRKTEVKKQKRDRRRGESSGLEILMGETWLNRSFMEAHGLDGLLQVDIVNFHLPVNKAWIEPSVYAYLQLGVADIMHILLAHHLGCKYIASFDSDFVRAKDIITEETGMTVLKTPGEILNIL